MLKTTFLLIFLLELILIITTAVAVMPRAYRYWKSLEYKKKVLALAWSALLVGQYQIFAHETVVHDVASLSAGATYQIIWMIIAGLIVLPTALTSKIATSVWTVPIMAFAAYIFFALGSTLISVAPGMSFYRGMQLTVLFLLAIVAYSESARTGRPDYLFNVSVFWLIVLMIFVIAGALILPDVAMSPNRGALGFNIRGVIPDVHPNELGLMSALVLIISLCKAFGGQLRMFWFSMAAGAGTVLFVSQARTSLAACAIAIMIAGFLVPRMRWLAYAALAGSIAVGFYYVLSGSSIGIEEEVVEYARRGASDEQLESMSGRTGLWAIGWEMFKDAPILGHGFQAGVRYKGIQYGLPLGTNMHSSHMQVLVDVGFLGYVAWLVFVLGAAARTFFVFRRQPKSGAEYVTLVAVTLVVFIILFRSVLGHVLVSLQTNLLIFFAVYLYAMSGFTSKRAAESGAESKEVLRPGRLLSRAKSTVSG